MDIYIDIGSTRIKWSNGWGKVFSVPFPMETTSKPPYYEVDPQKIWEVVSGIVSNKDIKRIFMSVQMHGYVLLDKNSRAVTNYISWRDRRAAMVKVPFTVTKDSGVSLKDNLPRASVYATKLLHPDLYNNANEFCTLGSYLMFRLTGHNITHITDAAASGYYNIHTCQGVSDGLKLPVALKDVQTVGFTTTGAVAYTPVGDQQAAVVGSNIGSDDYVMNLGTAGQLCCIEDEFVVGDFESRPYFDGKTLCTVTNLFAGSAVNYNSDRDWTESFFTDYNNALKKLPKRKKIIVTGGFVNFTKKKLIPILDRLNLPYEFNNNETAIQGLRLIAEGNNQFFPHSMEGTN